MCGKSFFRSMFPLRLLMAGILLLGIPKPQAASAEIPQPVSIERQRATAEEVIRHITSTTRYRFSYVAEDVRTIPAKDYSFVDADIRAVMDRMVAGTRLEWSEQGSVISISVRQQSQARQQQQTTLMGRVLNEAGHPLAGATVALKGTNRGASTDADGRYTLTCGPNDTTIEISYVGYKKAEILIAGRSSIDIRLEPETIAIDDVVVTGYQTISRERATGAYNTVNEQTIGKNLGSSLSTALVGTTAGMQGRENADGTVDFTIRGISTLHAGSEPLIVVDGFPVEGGFRDITPNDVESVTVLKDAAAASIWGARAGNGVIVVVTKKGRRDAGLNIEVSSTWRIGNKTDLATALTTASSRDQVDYEVFYVENGFDAGYLDNAAMLGTPYSLAREILYSDMSDAEKQTELDKLRNRNNRGQFEKYLLRRPVMQQYNLSVSQATGRSANYFSAMYEDQTGNVIKNGTNRWRLNFNNTTNLFSWLDLNVSANLHYAKTNTSGPTLSEMGALSPYEMLLEEDGSYAVNLTRARDQLAKLPETWGELPYADWSYNLLREVRGREVTSTQLNTRVAGGLTFKVMPGLSYASNFQYEYNTGETYNYQSEETYFTRDMVNMWNNDVREYDASGAPGRLVRYQYFPKGGILQRPTTTLVENWSWRNQVNFDRTFAGRHSITALAGMEITENQMSGRTYPWVFGYDPDKNTSSPLPVGDVRITSFAPSGGPGATVYSGRVTNTTFNYRNDRYVSVYGNFAYSYDGRYNLTGSIRSDASNMITDKASYRWAPLWSVGAMWHMAREEFMQPTDTWLDRLSVRLTFGYNGNVDRGTSPYTLISTGSTPSLITGTFVSTIAAMGNPTMRWERTQTLNVGIDFSLWSNTLFGSVDVYDKRGKDIIGTISQPSVTGSSSKRLNVAALYNRGFEVELGANVRITDRVGLSTMFTYAYNKNEITELFRTNVLTGSMLAGEYVEGYPVDAVWAYKYLGVQEDGIPYVQGVDGEPSSMSVYAINNAVGLDVLEYMGPAIDPHTLGWTGAVHGYGFRLSWVVAGKFGGRFRAPTFSQYRNLDRGKNIVPTFISEALNGGGKLIPMLPDPDNINNLGTYAYWGNYTSWLDTMVESSSHVKLKEITLEYTLPAALTGRIGLKQVRVTGQVRDLGNLWTKNSYGYDPEWLPGTMKPATTYALGLNINF